MMLARNSKRLLAMLMAMVMCLGLIATPAMADGNGGPTNEQVLAALKAAGVQVEIECECADDDDGDCPICNVDHGKQTFSLSDDLSKIQVVKREEKNGMYEVKVLVYLKDYIDNCTGDLKNHGPEDYLEKHRDDDWKNYTYDKNKDDLDVWDTEEFKLKLNDKGEWTVVDDDDDNFDFEVICDGSVTPDPVKHTVTFDSQGGSPVDAQEVLDEEAAEKPQDPTKDGYTFQGWYKDEAGTTPWDFNTPITSNITLYAKWEEDTTDPGEPTDPVDPLIAQEYHFMEDWKFEQYCLQKLGVTGAKNIVVWNIVIYDKNGEHTYLYTGDNHYYDIYNVNADRLSLNSGYIQTDEIDRIEVTLTWMKGLIAKGGTAVFDAEEFTYSEVKTPDKIIFNLNYVEVRCEPQTPEEQTYTVTLDANGGSFTIGDTTVNTTEYQVKSGKKLAENELPTPTRTGNYTFKGWYQDADGDTPWNFETPITQDGITLYAKWKANEPTEPGEEQEAWFFIRTDGVIPFEDGNQSHLAVEYQPIHPDKDESSDGMLTGTLYRAEQVWVDYTGPASGVTPDKLSMFSSVSAAIKTVPTAEAIKTAVPGYDPNTQMVLWYVVKHHDGGNQGGCPDWHVDGVICNKSDVYVGLTYDANLPVGVTGTVEVPASALFPAGTEVTVGTPAPTSIGGYTFTGWKDNATGNVYQPNEKITVTANTTLYAQWKQESAGPDKPTVNDLNALLDVVVDCTSNDDHANKTYNELLAGSYTIGDVVSGTCTVTIQAAKYVEDYNQTASGHQLSTSEAAAKTVALVYSGDKWQLAEGATGTVTFAVTCTTDPGPTGPEKPSVDDLNALLNVVVDCIGDTNHADKTYENLLAGSYTIGDVVSGTCTVTIQAAKYVEDYNQTASGHQLSTSEAAAKTVALVHSGDKWQLAEGATGTVTFTVTCSSGSGTGPSNPPYVPGGDDDDDDEIIVTINPRPVPSETPEVDLPDPTTPLNPSPEPSEEPTDLPDPTTPLAPGPDDGSGDKGEGSTDVDLPDGESPLGNLPQTGAVAAPVNPAITAGLVAMAFSMAGCGLYFTFGRKKGEEED